MKQILSLSVFITLPIAACLMLMFSDWKAAIQSTMIAVFSAAMIANWIYTDYAKKWHTNFVFSALMVLVASIGTFSSWATVFQVFSTQLNIFSVSLMVVSCLNGYFCYKNMFISKK